MVVQDMVAFCCYVYDGARKELEDMIAARERSWKGKVTKPGRVLQHGVNRVNGKCPLTPLELLAFTPSILHVTNPLPDRETVAPRTTNKTIVLRSASHILSRAYRLLISATVLSHRSHAHCRNLDMNHAFQMFAGGWNVVFETERSQPPRLRFQPCAAGRFSQIFFV
ncbi:GDP-fucose protein O-fucosyltransferase [Artemisia annua]|uniref:GDP-fucose protein O-fucosyltransferase n=1 Tax=Artemisia annua TaxID=35608 RepID=A0A2U1QFL1_ARTAN|nr:GDP-fucose protein O-fucosyltransferase [Artemisia annua]